MMRRSIYIALQQFCEADDPRQQDVLRQALAAARSQSGAAYRFIGEYFGAFLLKYARNWEEAFSSRGL